MRINLIQNKYDSKEVFNCEALKQLNEILQEGKNENLKEFYTNYFYLYSLKGEHSEFFGTEKATRFVIRKPGATIGMIQVNSELEVIDAGFYINDESLQKIMSISILKRMHEKVKEVFLGKKIRIIINGIHIETEEELVKEWQKFV